MLGRVVVENGVKKIVPLTADCGSGNPCGAIITVYQRTVPNGYLPLGAQYDITQFPVLYSILGTDTIPTASALGLPTLTTGQYVIKATSGINENQADNVLSALSPVDVVALNNVHSVTSNAVAQKINSLDVSSVGGSGKYISAISETDGKINATASNLATGVASGNSNPVTSSAVASAIVSLYEAQVRSSNLNSERHFLCSIDPATANRPTNYGVCFSFGFNTSSTDPNGSRWYFQLAFSTGNEIFVRTATNPTSSSTTPDNWTSWKQVAFV